MSNVIMLADESLGGVIREYREVSRKARVGERIKVVKEPMEDEKVGEIFTVTTNDDLPYEKDWVCGVYTDGKWDDGSQYNPNHENYVVLEPTDIVRINGVRYRMVERKAREGERVIVTKAHNDFHLGDIHKVRGYNDWHTGEDYSVGAALILHQSKSHVLEPLEVVESAPIDGRKAKIINAGRQYSTYVTLAEKLGYPDAAAEIDSVDKRKELENGDIVTLLRKGTHEYDRGREIWAVESANGERHLIDAVGIEIIENSRVTDDIANLARRLYEVERKLSEAEGKLSAAERKIRVFETQLRVAREDIVLIEEGVTDDIKTLSQRVAALEDRTELLRKEDEWMHTGINSIVSKSKCEPREVADSGVIGKRQKAELTRESVVGRAKADIAEIVRIGRDDDERLDGSSYYCGRWFDVDFAINREKRTVVALVYEIDGLNSTYERINDRPDSRGIAKCAPGDVFNIWLGKAISLRRALGLEVPDEYVNAPQPTEPKPGDVVRVNYDPGDPYRKINRKHEYFADASWFDNDMWSRNYHFKIVDDSCDGYDGYDYKTEADAA